MPAKQSKKEALFILPALVTVAVLLGLPLCMVIASSFDRSSSPGAFSFVFSLTNYLDLIHDDFYPRVLLRTVWLSLSVTVLALVLGFLLALKLWRCSPRRRGFLIMIIVAPLLVSVVARTYGWLLVLGEKGFINNLLMYLGAIDRPLKLLYNDAAIVFGLTHLLVAFPALAIHASLERIDEEIMEAAKMAGAGVWRLFVDVLFPMTVPGVVVGATFSFTLSMSAYVTPALMGGDRSALATLIYQKYIVSYDWNFGACLAILLLLGSLFGTLLVTAAFTLPYRARLAALREG
jgi:putative spermidine/putrescine transport system permease protein